MSKRSTNSLNLDDFLPYRLSIVTNKVSSAFASLYSEKFDLRIPEWRIMAVLGQNPLISADEVCTKTEMDKVTVSRAVTRLLKKKYIKRNFAKEDRRRSMLELSKSGYGVYNNIVPLADSFEKKLVETLTVNEIKSLENLLDKLNKQAYKLMEI